MNHSSWNELDAHICSLLKSPFPRSLSSSLSFLLFHPSPHTLTLALTSHGIIIFIFFPISSHWAIRDLEIRYKACSIQYIQCLAQMPGLCQAFNKDLLSEWINGNTSHLGVLEAYQVLSYVVIPMIFWGRQKTYYLRIYRCEKRFKKAV